MNKKDARPNKSADSQRKTHRSQKEQLPVSQHTPQPSIFALQRMIGNQAVRRLIHRTNSETAIQRVKKINEDVIIKGELMVEKSLSAQNLMASGGVAGNTGMFTGEVLASQFTPNGLGEGVQSGTVDTTTPTSGEPTGGGTDLSDLGLESLQK
jgi:hypothetical protein